jgi:hypothetical protein
LPLIAEAAAGEAAAGEGAAAAGGEAEGAAAGGGKKEGAGAIKQVVSGALDTASNVLGHAQKVANTPAQTMEPSPSLAADVKNQQAGKKSPDVINNFIDSTPKSAPGKILSGAMQMGRGAVRMNNASKQPAIGTQKPAAAQPVKAEDLGIDVVKSLKKKRN